VRTTKRYIAAAGTQVIYFWSSVQPTVAILLSSVVIADRHHQPYVVCMYVALLYVQTQFARGATVGS